MARHVASHLLVTGVRAQTAPAPPTLPLLVNQPAFGPGAALTVALALQHAGRLSSRATIRPVRPVLGRATV